MKAVKANRVYTIDEREKEARRAEGFDIYGDDGQVVAYAKGKTISYEEHLEKVQALEAALEAAKAAGTEETAAKLKALEEENKALKKELKKLQKAAGAPEDENAGKE